MSIVSIPQKTKIELLTPKQIRDAKKALAHKHLEETEHIWNHPDDASLVPLFPLAGIFGGETFRYCPDTLGEDMGWI